ncbi:TRAP transporter substrate-binding protein [Thermodesulfobacteriota bacterium]
MKRTLFGYAVALSICAVSITILFSGPVSAYSEKDPLILKASNGTPPGTISSKTTKRFCKLIEERTNGRVKFKMFFSGSLVKHPKFFDGVAKGIADIASGPISFVTNKIPDLSIFEVYGAYDLNKQLETVAATEPILNKIFEREGVRNIFHEFGGAAIFSHRTKFLKSPEDWKGQKMRIAGRWGASLAKKWGASPVFLGPGDMYTGLQRGIIDGYMLIWSFIYVSKLYEVAPYMTDSGLGANYPIVPMNLKKWNTLTKTDQEIFKQVGKEMNIWANKVMREINGKVKKGIIDKGGKTYALTPEQKSRYIKDCYALWPEIRKNSGPLGNKLADILENLRAR